MNNADNNQYKKNPTNINIIAHGKCEKIFCENFIPLFYFENGYKEYTNITCLAPGGVSWANSGENVILNNLKEIIIQRKSHMKESENGKYYLVIYIDVDEGNASTEEIEKYCSGTLINELELDDNYVVFFLYNMKGIESSFNIEINGKKTREIRKFMSNNNTSQIIEKAITHEINFAEFIEYLHRITNT